MIGVDTSFLIDFFKGKQSAVNWMDKNKDFLILNELIIYEFLCGNLRKSEKELFLSFVAYFSSLSFDSNASIKSSEIYRQVKVEGKTISHPDCMIAGTYMANNILKLVTGNPKHFQNIKGLEVKTY